MTKMKEVLEEFYPQEDIEEANIIPRPKFSWEKGTFTLWDVNNKIPLPAVVQCDTKSCPVPVDRSRFNFDLTQPLLLHRHRVIRKIPARSLYVDKVTQTYKEIGDPLLIPEDYKGWFSIVKKNNKGVLEDSVPHFTNIEEIATSDTEEFLIGGDKSIQTFQIIDNNNGNPIQQHRQMFPGDVLRKGKVFTGETKKKSKLLRKGKTVSEKFLLCTDDSDREVLIPFTQTGKFYSLNISSGQPGKQSRPVMQMSEIISKKLMPCVAKLVYGRVPNTPCSFTGILHLDKDSLEQSVIAATMLNLKNILLEIPILCNLKFRVAEIDKEVVSNKGYKNALSLCAEKAQIYMRNIKVCHSLEEELDPPSQCKSTNGNDIPPPTPHVMIKSNNGSISSSASSSTDKSADRDSGYVKMDSPTRDSGVDEQIFADDLLNMVGSEDFNTALDNSTYLFKISLGNKFMVVPVYEKPPVNYDTEIPKTEQVLEEPIDADDCNVPPPLSPPPPLPCAGPPPTPCGGSPRLDNRVPSNDNPGARRHSEQDNIYAAPKTPTRRVSAPPGFDVVPSTKPKPHTERRKRINRRGSQITFYEGCNHAVKATHCEIKRRMSETVLPEYDDLSLASGSSAEMILELEDSEEDEFPIYENIVELKEITDLFGHRDLNKKQKDVQSPEGSTIEQFGIIKKFSDASLSSGEDSQMPEKSTENILDHDIFKRISYFADDETDSEKQGKGTYESSLQGEESNNASSQIMFENATYCGVANNTAKVLSQDKFQNIEAITEEKWKQENETDLPVVETCSLPSQIAFENVTYTGIAVKSVGQSDNDKGKSGQPVVENLEENGTKTMNTDTTSTCMIPEDELNTPKTDGNESTENSKPSQCVVSNPCYGFESSSEVNKERTDDDKRKKAKIPPKTLEKTYKAKSPDFRGDSMPYNSIEHIQITPTTSRSRCSSNSSTKSQNENSSQMPKQKIHHPCENENKSNLFEMSVDELCESLKAIGLKQGTVDKIKENNVDGQSLYQCQENEESLHEYLPYVGLIEVQKISMFIKGWRNI